MLDQARKGVMTTWTTDSEGIFQPGREREIVFTINGMRFKSVNVKWRVRPGAFEGLLFKQAKIGHHGSDQCHHSAGLWLWRVLTI